MTKKIRHNLAQSCPYCTAGPHYSCGHVQAAAPQQEAQEPVAWLSTDSIGERYLCFTKPNDSDPVRPLVFGDTTPQQEAQEPATFRCLHEWDGLVRTSMPPKYACKHCHNFFDAPPSPAPQPAPLSDAIKHYLEAQDALDNREYAGINAESYEKLIRCRNASRKDLDAALAAQGGAP